MKIKTRLALMLVLIALLLGGTLLLLQRILHRETAGMRANLQEEAEAKMNGLLWVDGRHEPRFGLASQALHQFATDFSHWADMAAFVTSGDRAWAAANIDTDLETFRCNAAWVLRPDGTPVYGTVRGIDPSLRDLPLPKRELAARLHEVRQFHFFLDVPEGLLEVVSAPLTPAQESREEPKGWFLVARLWDRQQLDSYALVMEGPVELFRPGEPLPPPSPGATVLRELKGWDGRTLRVLRVQYFPPLLQDRDANSQRTLLLIALFGLPIVLVTFATVSFWVIRPLRQLEQSLRTGSPQPLGALLTEDNEFGRLARLAESSFRHRSRLEHEIQERQHTEEALRISLQLRQRLARDLHDSVIQSLYATGLGIESIRQSLPTVAEEGAEQRLDAARDNLNRTIREIRSFIADLEPEEPSSRPFSDELVFLAETLSSLQPAEIKAVITATPEPALTPAEQTHALQIVREAVSNALRHGQARDITLEYRLADGRPELEIRDRGRGFDPANPGSRGNGLANMRARAAEIRADLKIVSEPGRGASVLLRFHAGA